MPVSKQRNPKLDITRSVSGKSILLWISALFLLVSCGTLGSNKESRSAEVYYQVSSEIADDPEISALLAPYMNRMRSRMNQVIAWSTKPMIKGNPESTLGNLSADIVRFRAVRELRVPVHIGVVNNGGLRIPLPEGNITIGHIYELMPFENTITVLRLSGSQVKEMADQIALGGGQPVSGIRFRIQDGRATDILVNYEPLNEERDYLVATNNYMADGGENIAALWKPIERIDTGVLIRDAMIEYIRMQRHLDYGLEQRIRITEVE
jgi:2',3'-cyclic-nucleotide 2'-phosphodiesterase (5'-nucleotidase family)